MLLSSVGTVFSVLGARSLVLALIVISRDGGVNMAKLFAGRLEYAFSIPIIDPHDRAR
jgi:hypothetical protein